MDMNRLLTDDGMETTALVPEPSEQRIRCGWCGHPTDRDRCSYCGRDPELPWRQRATEPPVVETAVGRPGLDESEVRRLYAEAQRSLADAGKPVTVAGIAEVLDRSPRTVRDWKARWHLE